MDDDVKPDTNGDENISSKSVCDETSEDTNESAHQEGAEVDNHIRFGPGRPRIVRNGLRGRPRKLFNEIHAIGKCDIETPENVKEALNSPHADGWLKSMEAEYNSIIENDTWELTDLPKGQKASGCKWVYAVKRTKDGDVQKLK